MRRYVTDRFGMISSADIADALRRARARERAAEERRVERAARRSRRGPFLRGLFPMPPRTAH